MLLHHLQEDDELEVTRLEDLDIEDGGVGDLLPRRVSCGAHTLQLVVKDGLGACGASHNAVTKALQRLNAFIGATRRSTLAMEVSDKHGPGYNVHHPPCFMIGYTV